jgi:hypothetical protein
VASEVTGFDPNLFGSLEIGVTGTMNFVQELETQNIQVDHCHYYY